MKFTSILCLILLSLTAFAQNHSIVPKPSSFTLKDGNFSIHRNTEIATVAKAAGASNMLREKLETVYGFNLRYVSQKIGENKIVFNIAENLEAEAYVLDINDKQITITSSSEAGFYYGVQSLFQLIGPAIYGDESLSKNHIEVAACVIQDSPRFSHRGIMLDVSRHFMPKEDVMKLIDVLSIYKVNTLHWHLTDDQGWRIEIKKYPKLTSVGSMRKESMKGHYRNQQYDGTPHGGFYTQEDIKEVVAFAETRNVTIIPEIEMPGHAVAALASYPELGCSGGPYEVRTEWGVATDVFCPYEETFTFLENVLTEVMTLFPSKYIHIGGDECPKDSWKASEYCQNLIKEKDLKDEHGLQSYFIKRIDAFLSSRGRKLIGWDEILEGGLSPNATVMSWRGVSGGIQAAKEGHDVIMTPNSHVYLDYYQGPPETEPLAIGGYLPLEKVYSYEPIDPQLSSEEAKYILGVQGNLWTEYIPNISKAEYMLFPRMLAISEIGWSQDTEKNYAEFVSRVIQQLKVLESKKVKYATSLYSLQKDRVERRGEKIALYLTSSIPETEIRYTTDGTEPVGSSLLYDENGISIVKDTQVKAALFSSDKKLGATLSQELSVNLLTGKEGERSFKTTKYTGNSKNGLTDGLKGSIFKLDEWVGLNGEDLSVVYNLNKKNIASSFTTRFLHAPSSWIMIPKDIKLYGSKNGKKWKLLAEQTIQEETNEETRLEKVSLDFEKAKIKMIKITASNFGMLPSSHPGSGNPSWLFVDELELK